MPAHIRKGLITGAPAFNSGGLGLSIGSRVGGIRHKIATRAPDGGKSGAEMPDYNISGYYSQFIQNPRPADKPYINSVIAQLDEDLSSASKMFDTKPNSLILIFVPVDRVGGGDDASINVTLRPNGDYRLEDWVVNVSKNVYSITFPEVTYTFLSTDDATSISLYGNLGETLSTTSDTGKQFAFDLNCNGIDLAVSDDLELFSNTVIPQIFGKTYVFEMTANNQFNLSQSGVYPAGSYVIGGGA